MPKRSAQALIEHYERKIRKIEERQRKRRRIIPPLESSSSDNEGSDVPNEQLTDQNPVPANDDGTPVTGSKTAVPDEGPSIDPDLDPEMLTALGESLPDTPEYGQNIHETLTKLWLPILKKGMSKEDKDKIAKEYIIPGNCRLLQAPTLNAEISAAVPDMVRNRDKILLTYQQQLGYGITAVNRGIDMLLKTDDKIGAMKHLSNGCRLLCDSHHMSTQNRIKLVTPSLDKTLLHMINDGERDESLFGTKLSDKIKAAKAIEKQGLQIRKLPKPQKQSSNQSGTRSSSFQGNWTAPPRFPANRGGRGGHRKPLASAQGARRSYSTAPAQQSQRPTTQDKSRAQAPAHQ